MRGGDREALRDQMVNQNMNRISKLLRTARKKNVQMVRTDGSGRIHVQCPHCDHVFETHAAGDFASCEDCGRPFNRFTNAVETDGGQPICKNTGCERPVPAPSRTRSNLGRDHGFCNVVCLLEWEDEKRERREVGGVGGR